MLPLEDERTANQIPLEDRRRRVRKNPDGSLNQMDIDHNNRVYRKYFLQHNPWMEESIALGHCTKEEFEDIGCMHG